MFAHHGHGYTKLSSRKMARKQCITRRNTEVWGLIHEQERRLISEWREKRNKDPYREYKEFLAVPFGLETVRTFIADINIMVFIHMGVVVVAIYLFQKYNLMFDISVALFVSPIVFPLAFSINSDFQRREKVLEDLAAFKSAGIAWYFSMRELKRPAGLGREWVKNVRSKLISLLFLIGEYLLTSNPEKRRTILRAIYDDFAGAHELIEKLRASKLPANTAIVSRIIHFIHLMGLSVERLRVIRDYRSPRSIRSFNKVFILVLLIVLAPYFVHLGKDSNNVWLPYVLGIVVAFMFSTLLGVQDKLDDPFDGLGEDDINVDTMDEWAPILESVNPNQMLRQCKGLSFFEESLQIPPLQDESISSKDETLDRNQLGIGQDLTVKDALSSNNDCNVCSDYSVYSSPEISESNEQLMKGEHSSDQCSMLDGHPGDVNEDAEARVDENPVPGLHSTHMEDISNTSPEGVCKKTSRSRPPLLKSVRIAPENLEADDLDTEPCDRDDENENEAFEERDLYPKTFCMDGGIGSELFSPLRSSPTSRRARNIFDIQSSEEHSKEFLESMFMKKI